MIGEKGRPAGPEGTGAAAVQPCAMPLAALALVAALADAPAPAATDPHAFATAFAGRWRCGDTAWSFAPLAGDWTRVTYGDPADPAGIAVVGYVAGMHSWVYRDFHGDGSYADIVSAGPHDGTWDFSGPYYSTGGGPALAGRIRWIIDGPARFHRVFQSLVDGVLVPMGGDVCMRT